MEDTSDKKLVEDIVMDEKSRVSEINQMCLAAFTQSEKDNIGNLLFEDFKQCLFKNSPPVEELYTKARFVSNFGYSSRIRVYHSIKDFIVNHLTHGIRKNLLNLKNVCFITSIVEAWLTYMDGLNKINDTMEYMELLHINQYKLHHFDKLGIILFRIIILEYRLIEDRLKQDLIEMYQPALFMSNRFLIEDLTNMCIVLKSDIINTNYVIPLILSQSSKYFQSLSKDYLFQYCACTYFKNVEAKITEEMNRIILKFDPQTKNEFSDIMITELVKKNMKTIIEMENCGVVYMLKNNQNCDLKRMYNFLSYMNEDVKVMFDGMRPYIHEKGISVVLMNKDNYNINACIQNLLNLKKEFNNLKVNLFNNDTLFDEIVGGEFDYIINCNSLMPQYISLFIDQILREKKCEIIKGKARADIYKLIFMIQYLKNKEKFEYFYHTHLANRLLIYNYNNIKNENIIISKLQSAYLKCNGNMFFISKLQGMIKDKFVLSKMIMKNYIERVYVDKCIFGILQPFDLNVNVITPIHWSINPRQVHEIPPFALSVFNDFKTLYSQHNDKKKLILLPQFGSVELNATFYDHSVSTKQSLSNENSTNGIERVERKVNLLVSVYQMCVLELFNTHKTLTYEEILRKTKTDERILVKALNEMVFGKNLYQLLLKIPMVKEINLTDIFYVNESFEYK